MITHRDLYQQLKVCLDQPDDSLCRLAYADILEELGIDRHAQLIREIAEWKWTKLPFTKIVGEAWYVLGTEKQNIARIGYRGYRRYNGINYNYGWATKPWQSYYWQLSAPSDCYPLQGTSPNTHNAMRRVLREVLLHHKKGCICRYDIKNPSVTTGGATIHYAQ